MGRLIPRNVIGKVNSQVTAYVLIVVVGALGLGRAQQVADREAAHRRADHTQFCVTLHDVITQFSQPIAVVAGSDPATRQRAKARSEQLKSAAEHLLAELKTEPTPC